MADKTRKSDGHMPDGSDLHFWGVDAVYSDNPNSFNLADPKQVQARLDASKARLKARKQEG